MSLPTSGRVLITTSAGDIDIELWAKETPKTCRNFIALAMEGYYDGVIFHRIVPNFLVQTGDRSGTGAGGESVFGEPFEDEPHPRLRYIHRGLVGMANSGKKNTNDSQFFITLDQTPELQNKNTLFGRVVGDTLYNVLKIGDTELVKGTEKPVYPPTIKSIRILDNPFPDIIPRITAAEKKAQEKLRRQRDQERQKEQDLEKAKKVGKNKKLLSFDEPEEQEEVAFKKKAIVRPDLLDVTPEVLPDFVATGGSSKQKQHKAPAPPPDSSPVPDEAPKKKSKPSDDLSSIRKSHASAQQSASTSRQQEIEALESSIRRMSKRSPSPSFEDRKKVKKSYLQEELNRYKTKGSTKKGKGKKGGDEMDVMAALNSFRAKLNADSEDVDMDAGAAEGEEEWDRDTASFMKHELKIEDDGNREEMDKAQNDYEVLDPLAGSSHRTATFRPMDVNVRKDVIDVRDREKQAREEERERKARDRRDKGRHGRR